ncbi:MAG: hypothetical protein AB8G96_14245 [Phycisphaerales bacterium]
MSTWTIRTLALADVADVPDLAGRLRTPTDAAADGQPGGLADGLIALGGFSAESEPSAGAPTANATAVAVALIDPRGGTTEPDDPALVLATRGADAQLDPALRHALAAAAIAAARTAGHRRLVTGVDPLDAAGTRALETAGFRPTGRHPYFELGGGHVEYVMGYTDPTGATLDLAVDLAGP